MVLAALRTQRVSQRMVQGRVSLPRVGLTTVQDEDELMTRDGDEAPFMRPSNDWQRVDERHDSGQFWIV